MKRKRAICGMIVFFMVVVLLGGNTESHAKKKRLLFPVDRTISDTLTLGNIDGIYPWYNYIRLEKTVEIVNTLMERAVNGNTIFYDIYTDEEKKADPDKANTGLFFFKGNPGEKTAVVNAGGGSAGARMAALVGAGGPAAYGGDNLSRPSTVVTQYTGYSTVSPDEPPTYANVGTSDGIASYQTMQNRINQIKAQGTDAEVEVFNGLPHGFGLGVGTAAEGWVDRAVSFWEKHMSTHLMSCDRFKMIFYNPEINFRIEAAGSNGLYPPIF